MTEKSSEILTGLDAIQSYLGVSKPTLQKLCDAGLPIKKIEGSWYSTKTNIDHFFSVATERDPRIDAYLRNDIPKPSLEKEM